MKMPKPLKIIDKVAGSTLNSLTISMNLLLAMYGCMTLASQLRIWWYSSTFLS